MTALTTKIAKVTNTYVYFVIVVIVVNVVVKTSAQTEAIAEILVHGNHTTPDAEILALAGVSVGEPATADRLADAEEKLRASGRFEAVEVRRRYRSIAEPSEILVILLVDERANAVPMWLPIVGKRDGHALTYGVRVAFVDAFGARTRVSGPLTWGGERRAAIEVERTVGTNASPVLTLRGAASIERIVNPHFDVPDTRRGVRFEAEHAIAPWLRAGANARVAHVEFIASEWHQAAGIHATADTRIDPSFPRNAVHATAGWERIAFDRGTAGRLHTDLRGYVGIGGVAVLALRGQASRADAALPLSEWALVGGSESLRGYRAGHRAGDSMAAISAEVRVPLTSALSVGRFGVKGFADAGAAWAAGERIRKQQFDRGIGAGLYVGAAGITAAVDIAWPEQGKPRLHVQFGIVN